MTEKRFVCYFDNIMKKWYVQNTDSLDMYPVANEVMGEEFAHLLNLYHQTLNNIEKENEQLKKLLECSREEANDYCEELMEKDEFIRLYKSQRDDAIKENEQLKEEVKSLREDLGFIDMELQELEDLE